MSGRIMVATYEGLCELKFVGDVRLTLSSAIEGFMKRMFGSQEVNAVVVDLSEVDCIDSTSLGLLAKLAIAANRRFGHEPTLVSTHDDINRILVTMGFDDVFHITHLPLKETGQLAELPEVPNMDEDQVRRKVIDAHCTLMSMSARNHDTFKDLVAALETEGQEESPHGDSGDTFNEINGEAGSGRG